MFSEEIQRTIQQRQLESGSQKQFVFNKVPESVFLTWLFQQYELLHQLQIASNETCSSVSSLLSDMLPQQNSPHGFKTLDSTEKCSKNRQEYSSLCYSQSNKHPGALKRTELKQNLCNVKPFGSLSQLENKISSLSSAFCQISISDNRDQFKKRRTICPINEATSYANKAYLLNKERYIESTENHIYNINVDLNDFSHVHRFLFCREECSPFSRPSPSFLHLSVIPQPFLYVNDANPPSTLEILNNNTILYPVPHSSETISPKTVRSNTFQPTCMVSDCNDQNDQPLYQTLPINKSCSESNPSLPLFVLKSDSSIRDSFHSVISSCMAQFNEERLDDECFNTFDPFDPPVPRDLQNPIAKLLSGGDDKLPVREKKQENSVIPDPSIDPVVDYEIGYAEFKSYQIYCVQLHTNNDGKALHPN